MQIKNLDGEKFYQGFSSGASLVEENRSYLNEINLFPVPDSDTGNNMSYTLNSTAARVSAHNSIYSTLESISDYIVRSARGNSGLIMAQFFSGIHEKMTEKSVITTEDFAAYVNQAVSDLYESISEPVEGTMLTVIREWAERLTELAENIDDFVLLFEKSLETARNSLERTREQLPVHRKADTVDAGAQGFVLFLEGVLKNWRQERSSGFHSESSLSSSGAVSGKESELEVISGELSYRYCTEVFIQSDISFEKIKELLEKKGDSLLVAGSGGSTRVHIHTDTPAEVVSLLRDRGKIVEQKVDDMLRQQQLSHEEKGDVALVTDSIADIPREILDDYGIHVIPLNILFEGTNYIDRLTITPEILFDYLESSEEFPSSSQPDVDYIKNYLEQLADNYKSILIISVSEELSGTGEAFKQARDRMEKEKDVEIAYINSRSNSGSQGLLVLKAAEELERGEDLQTVLETVRSYRDRAEIFVNVNDFEYMVRGGRVSAGFGWLADLLNFKPIISLDEEGNGTIKGKCLTHRGVRKKIIKYVKEIEEKHGVEKYSLVHSLAPGLIEQWQDELERLLGFEPEYVTRVSSITALNSGPGSVGVSLLAGQK